VDLSIENMYTAYGDTTDSARRTLRSSSSTQTTSLLSNIHATRLSDTHYTYSFNFEYDISTSSDPSIAGHASDIIVGGGIDVTLTDDGLVGMY
jgi:hypothetical protein